MKKKRKVTQIHSAFAQILKLNNKTFFIDYKHKKLFMK